MMLKERKRKKKEEVIEEEMEEEDEDDEEDEKKERNCNISVIQNSVWWCCWLLEGIKLAAVTEGRKATTFIWYHRTRAAQ
jgi:hypothetical protein